MSEAEPKEKDWREKIRRRALFFVSEIEDRLKQSFNASMEKIPIKTAETGAEVVNTYLDVMVGVTVKTWIGFVGYDLESQTACEDIVRRKFERVRALSLTRNLSVPPSDEGKIEKAGKGKEG